MKTLIVDDEKHVRQAIRMLIDWESTDIVEILEAENGAEAIETIRKEKPEIVITDMMMPVKNGIKLMEWIQEYAPSSKTIVVSGHKDYEFLRCTVKYGGMDYILKPIDPPQLQTAIDKAVAAWKSEHLHSIQALERNMELNQLRYLYLYQALTNLIDQPSTSQADKERIYEDYPQLNDVQQCHVAILSLKFMPQQLLDKFKSSMDLLEFSLLNICNEQLALGKHGISFKHNQEPDKIVILLWGEPDKIESLVNAIHQSIWRVFQVRLAFGIGSAQPFPHQLKQSYLEACELLDNRNLLDHRWIYVYGKRTLPAPIRLFFRDFEERISLAVKHGGDEHIVEAVDSWVDAMQNAESVTINDLQQWDKEIEIVLTQLEDELREFQQSEFGNIYVSSQNTIQINDHGHLNPAKYKDELTARLLDLAAHFRKARASGRGNNVINDIARYIRNNYNQELTLQEIADHFYLSREYISRRFKQETGENIVEYLSHIRIEKAKELLTNPELRIFEISQAIGYQDEKYFSKVFKKLEGVSPNKFRKTLLN